MALTLACSIVQYKKQLFNSFQRSGARMTNAVESIIIHVLEIHNGIKVPVDAVTARKKDIPQDLHKIVLRSILVLVVCNPLECST